MSISQHDQARIDQFFTEIESFDSAYQFPTFRFVMLRCNGIWTLLRGVVSLNTEPPQVIDAFESADIGAGEIPLSALAPSPHGFLGQLLTGTFALLSHDVAFPPDHSGNYSAHHWPFDGAQRPRDRSGMVVIHGSNNYHHFANEPPILRQLRTSPGAFSSLKELAALYRVPYESGSNPNVEICAPSIAEIAANSRLEHGRVVVELRLAGPLDPGKVNLRMRGTTHKEAETRLDAPELIWKRDERSNWNSLIEAEFPGGEMLDCILSYDGLIQEERTVKEPVHLHNTLRLAYDTFDPDDKAFERVIEDHKIKNRDGRELESTLSAILALAGFRLVAVDHLPGLEEVPDIIAADDRGNLLVIECTLSLPNADDKLAKLHHRHHVIRRALDEARLGHIETVPLLAVALPRSQIESYLADAQKADILLWGREDLHRLRADAYSASAGGLFDMIAAHYAMLSIQMLEEY